MRQQQRSIQQSSGAPCYPPLPSLCFLSDADIGICCAGISEIYQRPAVADLLLSCAAAAAACPAEQRRPLLFTSLPSAYTTGTAVAGQAAPPNFHKLRDALLGLPPVSSMAETANLQVRP